jgi:hypothetical protein
MGGLILFRTRAKVRAEIKSAPNKIQIILEGGIDFYTSTKIHDEMSLTHSIIANVHYQQCTVNSRDSPRLVDRLLCALLFLC